MEWVSVNDELPSPFVEVLVHPAPEDQGVMYCSGLTAEYDKKNNRWLVYCEDSYSSWNEYLEVTHWMPLPEPPTIKQQ